MPSIRILSILTTLLCIAQSQSQNLPPSRLRSDLVEDGVLVGPGSLRFSTSVEDSNSLRPRFKLFRSSIDIDDEVKEEETTPDFLSGTEVNQEPAVEEEEGVPKSKQKFHKGKGKFDSGLSLKSHRPQGPPTPPAKNNHPTHNFLA